MSKHSAANDYRHHVRVIPEDTKDAAIANGFLQHPNLDLRAIQILPPAGGWEHARDLFLSDHVKGMRNKPLRYTLLLIDFDNNLDRFQQISDLIPKDIADRVFIIGPLDEPEGLPPELGKPEQIGSRLAEECYSGSRTLWNHDHFKHNEAELNRMAASLRPFLFR